MAPMKAKAVTVLAGSSKFAKSIKKSLAMKRPAAAAEEEEEAGDAEEVEEKVSKKTMKRPAAASAAEAPSKKGKKESPKPSEENIVEKRTKELKAMSVADLKDFVKSKSLETGLKTDMIEAVLAMEVKAREAVRAHQAKVKEVATTIKKDFETKSSPDLKELCDSKGLKKGGSKNELVERLVQKAKEDGEVDKVLANMARDARRQELADMGKDTLSKMCSKLNVDPLVKEVMVERLLGAEMPVKA